MMQQKMQYTSKPARRLLFSLACIVVIALAGFSFLCSLLICWLEKRAFDQREFRRGLWAATVFCGIVYAFWLSHAFPLLWFWQGFLYDLTHHIWLASWEMLSHIWLLNLWLSPLCAILLASSYPHKRGRRQQVLKGVSDISYEHEERKEEIQALAQFEQMTVVEGPSVEEVSDVATHAATIVVPAQSQLESLGAYRGGELSEWVESGEFCLPASLFDLHGIVIGEPSFGKTNTLLYLVSIAKRYGRQIIYLDLKGSRKTAAQFLALMSSLNVKRVKMFPREAYDGWRGDTQTLFNRLMDQIDPSTHPFYRAGVGATALSLALRAPGGSPQNSSEFLERLDTKWLRHAYAGDSQAQREIRDITPHLGGLALIFAGFFRGVAGALDGQWAFEDADAIYIGIDGTANKEEAAMLGRYLLEDAAHYATSRKDRSDQVTLIIDEFGVLRSTNATDLFERVRESGMSVYAAAQSYQSLGRERDNVLAASAVKILHRSGSPEPVVKYAGEREHPAFSYLVGGGNEDLLPLANGVEEWQKSSSVVRSQKEYAVPVEDVQQLQIGTVAFICGGQGAFVQVHLLALGVHVLQAAERFLASSPHFQPLPPPTQPRQPGTNALSPAGSLPIQPPVGGKKVGTGTVSPLTQPPVGGKKAGAGSAAPRQQGQKKKPGTTVAGQTSSQDSSVDFFQ